jgi:hypothetical protein
MDADLHIWIADRASTSEDFVAVRKLVEVGTDLNVDWVPTLTGDGLTLFFQRVLDRYTIFVATRERRSDIFSGASQVASLDNIGGPYVTPNGQAIYFGFNNGGYGVFHAERVQGSFVFGPRSEHQELSARGYATLPVVSADELTIYFPSERAGGFGYLDIYRARRSNRNDPFGEPELVSELSSGDDDVPNWISPDQCTIYMHRFAGAERIFVAKRTR